MQLSRLLLPGAALLAATACSNVVASSRPAPAPQSSSASTAATLKIPPGHLPPPGECRVWLPDVPPGQQKAAKGNGKGHGEIAAGP